MSTRVIITLSDSEFQLLRQKSEDANYTPSQMAKYIVLGELGIPRKSEPIGLLIQILRDYVQQAHTGQTFYVFSPFSSEQWWSFDTGTKRALAWELKRLEKQGLCQQSKEEGLLPNGTHRYSRI